MSSPNNLCIDKNTKEGDSKISFYWMLWARIMVNILGWGGEQGRNTSC